MKILVTGGAGYIGSVVAEQLVRDRESVVVFDNLSTGHRAAVPGQAIFVEGDLNGLADIDAALSQHRPDAIVHFAAHSSVGASMLRPFEYLGENVVCGLNLLQSAVEHGVRRFILSSTANLFDRPDRIPISEEAPIVPGSPYGESKYLLERMLPWLEQIHGLRYAILRYFNAAGATATLGEDRDPQERLIPIILTKTLDADAVAVVTINGDDFPTPDGTCVRDYIHVSDLAQAHVLALQAIDQHSRVYNLGNGRGFSVQEVVQAARRITGRPIPTRIGPRRPGDPPTLVASSEKIRRELGWAPRFPELDEIVRTAWDWHRTHPHGYGDRGQFNTIAQRSPATAGA